MKLLLAIVQPLKVDTVREALKKIGVTRMTVCDAQGYGQQLGQSSMFREQESHVRLLRKVALEIVVNDDFVDRAIETIELAARTGPEGQIGDGKVFVLPVEETIRLGLTAEGPEAV